MTLELIKRHNKWTVRRILLGFIPWYYDIDYWWVFPSSYSWMTEEKAREILKDEITLHNDCKIWSWSVTQIVERIKV